jgi:isoquinoline 1-oxidoreductase alpha subunit
MISLTVNGKNHEIDVEPDTPLLWVVREQLGLLGTKFGCGIAQCGACTMLINGQATRTCVFPVSAAQGLDITTIEGLSENNDHPVQKAWQALEVPQCGYCQSGQILSAVSLLNNNPNPSDQDINLQMTNICRCGTYPRIREAVHEAAKLWTNAAANLETEGEKV